MRQEAGYDGHCIPVLTSAVARGDWRRELKRWWPEAHVHIVSMDDVVSRKKKTKKGVTVWQESLEDLQVRRQAEWVPALRGERGITFLIAAYQSARTVLDQALKHEVLFDSIICDEAHALSHYHTETSKAVRPLVSKSRTAFLLTGTPIYNRPYDLYNLLETCVAGYGSSMYRWAERYFMVRVTAGGFGKRIEEFQDSSSKTRLIQDIKPLLLSRSVQEAYGELPAVQRVLKRVEAPEAFRISPAKVPRDGGQLDRVLRDCASRKLQAAAELVDDLREPVVLYCYKKEHVVELARRVEKLGHRCTIAMGVGEEGGTTAKKRDVLIEQWKSGATLALCCTMDAVKESATLTRAAVMIFCDFDWVPSKMLQCEGRIDPARQPENDRRPVSIYYLSINGGPDEVVAERLIEKIEAASGIGGSASDNLLAGALRPLALNSAQIAESPEEAMVNLIAKMEVRAERLMRVGLWGSDDE